MRPVYNKVMQQPQGIYIGTSGWSYPQGEGTWRGHFYPPGTKNELAWYSQFFNTVEVNSSFYRPPAPAMARRWAEVTPDGFLFSVKLWQNFTHPRMYEGATGEKAAVSARDVEQFMEGIAPLARAGKLGALLAQFPPSFVNDEAGRQALGTVMRAFGNYRLAVELRHRSWSDYGGTVSLLEKSGAMWVSIDEPRFASSVAADTPLTGGAGYFRFHGRNAENWWKGNVETRYKYLYSGEEIRELAARVEQVASKAPLVFAYFNNHYKAFAPRNAADLVRALQLPFTGFPAGLLRPEE